MSDFRIGLPEGMVVLRAKWALLPLFLQCTTRVPGGWCDSRGSCLLRSGLQTNACMSRGPTGLDPAGQVYISSCAKMRVLPLSATSATSPSHPPDPLHHPRRHRSLRRLRVFLVGGGLKGCGDGRTSSARRISLQLFVFFCCSHLVLLDHRE